MKRLLFLILLLPLTFINAQKIGKLAPPKPLEIFPNNAWGADIMFSEGGFGLGTFYRYNFKNDLAAFVDFSISESKDEREVEYYDYYTGQTYTIGKVKRVFMMPVNFGMQFRLFKNEIEENLRPFVTFGIGPNFVLTTPYSLEFFNSFGKAQIKYALGGYIGFGADFGLNKKNLVGLNIRYYYSHLFDEGVENLQNSFRKDLGSFFITLRIGSMF
ncbi:MAG: outer membrane beta-barrel protein [bacterium]